VSTITGPKGPNSSETSQADVTTLLPDSFAYIITFIFLGALWISHQNMFSHIENIDLKTLWINLLLLLSVGIAPFYTGRYWDLPSAIHCKCFLWVKRFAISISFNILWFYPRVQRSTDDEPNPDIILKRSRIVLVGPAV